MQPEQLPPAAQPARSCTSSTGPTCTSCPSAAGAPPGSQPPWRSSAAGWRCRCWGRRCTRTAWAAPQGADHLRVGGRRGGGAVQGELPGGARQQALHMCRARVWQRPALQGAVELMASLAVKLHDGTHGQGGQYSQTAVAPVDVRARLSVMLPWWPPYRCTRPCSSSHALTVWNTMKEGSGNQVTSEPLCKAAGSSAQPGRRRGSAQAALQPACQ